MEFINATPIESNNAVPVNIQDQHSTDVAWYFREVLNVVTLANTITVDSYTCNLVAGHNVVIGETLVLKEGTAFFQATVLNVVINAITIDRPFDFAFTSAATGQRCNVNMAVDGSTTPRIFYTSPSGLTDVSIDYTKIHFYIEDGTAMTGALFGGITALTRGVVVRSVNGVHKVHFNIKKNGDLGLHCDSVDFDDRASGSNIWTVCAVKRFSGQENQGVTIRLNSVVNDQLQIIIQDNLTGLIAFNAVAQGHVVQD